MVTLLRGAVPGTEAPPSPVAWAAWAGSVHRPRRHLGRPGLCGSQGSVETPASSPGRRRQGQDRSRGTGEPRSPGAPAGPGPRATWGPWKEAQGRCGRDPGDTTAMGQAWDRCGREGWAFPASLLKTTYSATSARPWGHPQTRASQGPAGSFVTMTDASRDYEF